MSHVEVKSHSCLRYHITQFYALAIKREFLEYLLRFLSIVGLGRDVGIKLGFELLNVYLIYIF